MYTIFSIFNIQYIYIYIDIDIYIHIHIYIYINNSSSKTSRCLLGFEALQSLEQLADDVDQVAGVFAGVSPRGNAATGDGHGPTNLTGDSQ